ncbi:MAG: hypothetical protein ACOC2R_03275 [Spirochaetota bacterium]
MHSGKAGQVEKHLSLGIDLSTQSITGVGVDPQQSQVVYERSLSYVADARLHGFGIDHQSFLLPPRRRGEADQTPALFLAALEALCEDMQRDAVPMLRIAQLLGDIYSYRTASIWMTSDTVDEAEHIRRAAAAGFKTLSESGYTVDPETTIEQLLSIKDTVAPEPSYVQAYHGESGYLRRLISVFEQRAGVE